MNDSTAPGPPQARPAQPALELLPLLLSDQRQRWRSGERVLVEEYFERLNSLATGPEGLLDLICNEVMLRTERGEAPQLAEYARRFADRVQDSPAFAAELRFLFEVEQALDAVARSQQATRLDRRSNAVAAETGGTPARREFAAGSYELLGTLGHGGMGVVYKARQQALNRTVALKMIQAGDQASPEDRARFRREAEAVAQLQHPNIVQIYEVGEQEGQPFFSLEYVSGGSLADRLQGVPQPAADAAALVETLARAIHYAHERGIMHRDLKPANILLAQESGVRGQESGTTKTEPTAPGSSLGSGLVVCVPKITDFGLAKRLDAATQRTTAGSVLGTPSYMAPEQALGQTDRVGPAADIYALGAILYEVLTGRPPFRAETAVETLYQVVYAELVPPARLQPAVPRDLDTVARKCLEKDPGKRYAGALALAEDLRRFRSGEPIQARPATFVERGVKWARRHRAVTALAALVGFVALVGFAGVLAAWRDAVQARDRETAAKEAARAERLVALEQLYAYNLRDAYDAWLKAQPGRLEELLAAQLPRTAGDTDLRGFEWYYLDRLGHGELHTLPGAQRCVAWSPDGRLLATAGDENTVRLWDPATGKEVRTLRGHRGPVRSVAFCPDGRLLASGSYDSTVKLWDPQTGRELATLREHTGPVTGVAFRRDGKVLASASQDRTVRLWDVAQRKVLLAFHGHASAVLCVAFHPGGELLASAGLDPYATLWDMTGRIKAQFLRKHTGPIAALAFSPDGRVLASASHDQTVQLTHWTEGEKARSDTLRGHSQPVTSVAYSPDGRRIATASWDRTLQLWDAGTGRALRPFRGHRLDVEALAFSPDGSRLASTDRAATRIWDVFADPDPRTLRGHTGLVRALAFRADGQQLVSAGNDKAIVLWDVPTGRLRRRLTGHADWVTSVTYRGDGRQLASAGRDALVRLWDPETGTQQFACRGHRGTVYQVCYECGGQFLVSAGDDGTVKLWKASNGAFLRDLTTNQPSLRCLALNPEGRLLAVGGADGSVRIWELATGRPVATLPGHAKTVTGLAYSPDGSLLASASADGTARLWEVASGKERAMLPSHGESVHGIAFSGDGRRLATVGHDKKVRLWDPALGQEIFVLPCPAEWLEPLAVAFSPDSLHLAAGGGQVRKGETILWDAAP